MALGMKVFKYMLFGFNVIFWIAGLAAIGIGIWMYFDPGRFNDFLGDYNFRIPSLTLIASGVFVCFVGGCGCVGAIQESRCLLATYFAMLLIIFTAEAAAGVLAFLYREKVDEIVTKEAKDIILNKFGMGNEHIDFAVNTVQNKMSCCGAESYKDYLKSQWWLATRNRDKTVPESCCDVQSRCIAQTLNPYTDGCIDKVKSFLEQNMLLLALLSIVLAVIQLFGLAFSCTLFFSIDKNYTEM